MILRLLVFITLVVFEASLALPVAPNEYEKWKSDMLDAIEEQGQQPSDTAIEKLSLWMIQSYDTAYNKIKEGSEPIYHAAQNALMAIPGHAEYYAKKITDERKYSTVDNANTEMLLKLPSPETLKVLGRFLEDTHNDWTDVKMTREQVIRHIMEVLSEEKESPDFTSSPSSLARMTLERLGVRGLPAPDMRMESMHYTNLLACRQWWNEVKSGQRSFSFIGQLVEYRFKSDGTVESVALPAAVLEHDPKPAKPAFSPAETLANQLPEKQSEQSSRQENSRWPWIVGTLVAVVASVVWLRFRFFRPI